MLNTYDGYGRRISRLVKGKELSIPEPEYTEYLWDGTNVLLEFYQNQNNLLEYVYGNGQLISRADLLKLPVSGRIVFQGSHYFHHDGLGSVVNLTDEAGKVTLSYNYDAFGEITKEEGQVGWKKNRYTFTGKPYDPSAGMYYFGARWYEPEVGRFVTQDPLNLLLLLSITHNPTAFSLAFSKVPSFAPNAPECFVGILPPQLSTRLFTQALTTNLFWQHKYIYTRNNPINYIDPTGLWTIGIGVAGNAGVGAGVGGAFLFVIDGHGNIGIVISGGGGSFGGVGASGGGQFQWTNGDTIYDLGGVSTQVGGTILIGGVEYYIAERAQGVNVNIGPGQTLGLPPRVCVEEHGMVELSGVLGINLPDLINKIINWFKK